MACGLRQWGGVVNGLHGHELQGGVQIGQQADLDALSVGR